MTSTKDIPGVRMPPALAAFLTIVFGFLFSWLFSTNILNNLLPFSIRFIVGIILVGVGIVLIVLSVFNFHRIGTNVPPWKPSVKLSNTGIYSHIRNPIYVGFIFIIAGTGIGFAADGIIVLLIPYIVMLHMKVILREEKYLEHKFGDDYRFYKTQVPRYGWRRHK